VIVEEDGITLLNGPLGPGRLISLIEDNFLTTQKCFKIADMLSSRVPSLGTWNYSSYKHEMFGWF